MRCQEWRSGCLGGRRHGGPLMRQRQLQLLLLLGKRRWLMDLRQAAGPQGRSQRQGTWLQLPRLPLSSSLDLACLALPQVYPPPGSSSQRRQGSSSTAATQHRCSSPGACLRLMHLALPLAGGLACRRHPCSSMARQSGLRRLQAPGPCPPRSQHHRHPGCRRIWLLLGARRQARPGCTSCTTRQQLHQLALACRRRLLPRRGMACHLCRCSTLGGRHKEPLLPALLRPAGHLQ